jgi:hypothetical protein
MKKNHRKSHVKQKKSKAIREGIGEQRGNNVPLKDNRDPYTDTMRQVNAAIAACKNEALKRGGNIWKADLVDEAVRGFLIPNLMHIESGAPPIRKEHPIQHDTGHIRRPWNSAWCMCLQAGGTTGERGP